MEQPARDVIANLGRDDWNDHLEFILGDKVLGRQSRAADGSHVYRAPWSLVLELEYQIRKQACYLLNTTDPQLTMGAALKNARGDRDIIEEHFLTPMSLAAGTEAALAASSGSRQRPGAGRSPQRQRSPPRARSRTPPVSNKAKRRLKQKMAREAKKAGEAPAVPVPPGGLA